jgi:hypothetical protein
VRGPAAALAWLEAAAARHPRRVDRAVLAAIAIAAIAVAWGYAATMHDRSGAARR